VQTTAEPAGTTTVVLCAGGDGLLLLRLTQPVKVMRAKSMNIELRMCVSFERTGIW
jgi:hypothetical protein